MCANETKQHTRRLNLTWIAWFWKSFSSIALGFLDFLYDFAPWYGEREACRDIFSRQMAWITPKGFPSLRRRGLLDVFALISHRNEMLLSFAFVAPRSSPLERRLFLLESRWKHDKELGYATLAKPSSPNATDRLAKRRNSSRSPWKSKDFLFSSHVRVRRRRKPARSHRESAELIQLNVKFSHRQNRFARSFCFFAPRVIRKMKSFFFRGNPGGIRRIFRLLF